MREKKDARRAERLVDEGIALAAKDVAAARERFAQARALDPACYPAYLNGATIEAREGKFDVALPLARRATELKPEEPDAWAALGHALLRTEGADQAVGAFETVMRLEPGSARGSSGMGVALTDLRRGEAAVQHLRRALEMGADERAADELQLLIGLNELRLGRFGPASVAFQAAQKRRPGFPEPNYLLAVARARMGEMAEAKKLLAQACIAGLPNSPLDVGEWLRAECGDPPYPREVGYEDPDAGVEARFRIVGVGMAEGIEVV